MKILIWNTFKLENKGGPSGYLYNLRTYLDDKINYLDDYLINNNKEIKKNKLKNKLKKIKLLVSMNEFLKIIKINRIINQQKKINKKLIYKNFSQIHVHTTLEFYQARNFFNLYNGIKILSSHSPELASIEMINNFNFKIKFIKNLAYKLFKKIDKYSFVNTDYIIFPCEDAMEPYLKDQEIKNILKEKQKNNKIKFLPTGIVDKKIEFQEDYFYNNYGIPKDGIILCYIGRHNEIKGYDYLIKIGKELLEKNKKIYIVVCGTQNPNIKPLDHERWIELGWTTEGDNIMKHSHGYLLPNKETYFDLVFLEALRAGTTIICSETGGNKYFKKYNSSEIIFFDREQERDFIEKIEQNLEKFEDKNYLKNRNINRKIYEENFTIDIFGDNYLKIMDEIYEESKS